MHTIIVIFWSTWDLAKRKLFPALYNMYKTQSHDIDIIWVWRRSFDTKDFVQYIKEKTESFISDQSLFKDFFKKVSYTQVEINNQQDYITLKNNIIKKQKSDSQILLYLSISPELFPIFIDNYKNLWLQNIKVIFEKPFGTDLISARELNKKITEVFEEKQVYRIDHYVWKEAVQNIVAFRFANTIFEPIWNNKYIDNIQITASESIGVWDRWPYYEKSWALRDMLQNHLFQMLALVMMDMPSQIDEIWIWKTKLALFNEINIWKNFSNNVVFWQYIWYKNESWVDPDSRVETFVAAKIQINNDRYRWIPIYLRTWKYMKRKITYIVIEFKSIPDILFNKYWDIQRNRIVLEVDPSEGISIHFNIKENGNSKEVQRVRSQFVKDTPSKEAYQKLIEDAIVWDKTLFTSREILEKSREIVDNIVNCKKDCPIIFPYEKNTDWPEQSDYLLSKDWRKWYKYQKI